jgi:phosphodiesterase/alkaline phosphatase D-like protein
MSQEKRRKFHQAIQVLKPSTEYWYSIEAIENEEHFNQIQWKTSEDSNNLAIMTTTCPHSEITWTKVKEEMDKL